MMNTLLFDAGNSRLKWSLVRDGRMGRMHAVDMDDIAAFQKRMAAAAAIGRAVGVCVAGPALERHLKGVLQRNGHAAPEFLRSSATAAGVRNGYREAWRLGDDRWAGIVAAWRLAGSRSTACAISVGSALTIDLVDQDGQHRGGLIAPGPGMMLAALLDRTHGIARRASGRGMRKGHTVGPLADNTRDAIESGCLSAAAALVDRTIAELSRKLGARPAVLLTGGGADYLQPLLKGRSRLCPDLVLRGVALIAGVRVRRIR